jgi:small-conductance mechanosensitive channel/CRP-like cAMP-binding protein
MNTTAPLKPQAAAAAPNTNPVLTRLWLPALLLVGCLWGQGAAPGFAWWPAAAGGDGVLAARLARLLATLTWMSGLWFVIRAADVLLWERLLPRLAGVRFPRLLQQVLAVVIAIVGLAVLLSHVWGFAVTPVLAATGAIGIVAGLALRNLLADFFSGIALSMEHPFRLEDFVLLHIRGKREPVAGFVKEINWRSTTVLTPEDNLISVPNSVVAQCTVENLSFPSPVYELELDIVLDWHLSSELIERVLGAAMVDAWARGATSGDKPPKFRISKLDGSGVAYRIVYLIDPRRKPKGPARHLLLSCVQRHLRLAGLKPVRTDEAAPEAPQRPWELWRGDDRARVLDQVPLLQALTAPERLALASAQPARAVEAGQAVVGVGDAGDSLFVVAAGVLEVRLAETGGRAAVLSPGEWFGEMSLLTGAPRSATVVALTAATLIEIRREQLAPLLQARGELASVLAAAVAEHQRNDEAARAAALGRAAGAPNGRADALLAAMKRWLGI